MTFVLLQMHTWVAACPSTRPAGLPIKAFISLHHICLRVGIGLLLAFLEKEHGPCISHVLTVQIGPTAYAPSAFNITREYKTHQMPE